MRKIFECGVCGADVPEKALACPGCGADEQTGLYDETPNGPPLDFPGEDDFDYDRFAEREFGQPRKKSSKELLIAAGAIVLIVAMILLLL